MHKEAIKQVKEYLLHLQNDLITTFTKEDGKGKFQIDEWVRPQSGSGKTCSLENGAVFEKGAVNFSHVSGSELPAAAIAKHRELAGSAFEALGVSVVMHPLNPYTPTSHMNVRFFVALKPNGETVWWFGGGFDLTPYYGFADDCVHWHRMAQQACEPFGKDIYPELKKACDEYFYLKHRQEPRGIGGLFFDEFNQLGFEQSFAFMRSVAEHFKLAYQPIVDKRKHTPYGQRERDFQCYRRGRYVEFNLLYDRGTLFGLQFGGRVESILVSLPPLVTWRYDWQPEPFTPEAELYERFLVAKDWLV